MFEYLFRSFLPLYNPIGFGAAVLVGKGVITSIDAGGKLPAAVRRK